MTETDVHSFIHLKVPTRWSSNIASRCNLLGCSAVELIIDVRSITVLWRHRAIQKLKHSETKTQNS